MSLIILPSGSRWGREKGAHKAGEKEMGWSSRKEGSSQLKPSPIYPLLRGMEKAGCSGGNGEGNWGSQ